LTVPLWAWAAFLAFVAAMLLLDLLVLRRGGREVPMREAGIWSGVWIGIGLGFGGLLWAWAGGVTAQAYLAGYLIEKSLSVDNIFLFAAIFSALAIPARSQHQVRPGLAVILGAVAVKLLLADVWEFPAWSAPAFITAVLAVVVILSVTPARSGSQAGQAGQAGPAAADGSRAGTAARGDSDPDLQAGSVPGSRARCRVP
jgi:hypothetical protein